MNTRNIGSFYEDQAIEYLENNGFDIIERNFHCDIGEIDVIARKMSIIRFIEVKYRKNSKFGGATYAINQQKLKKIYKIAQFYILKNRLNDQQFSIDVLAITGNKYEYFENVFGAM